jgi:hypothetical protein
VHVTEHGKAGEELRELIGPHDAAAHQAVRRLAGYLGTLEAHAAGGRAQDTGEQVEQRRLAGAVGPDQATDFSAFDR